MLAQANPDVPNVAGVPPVSRANYDGADDYSTSQGEDGSDIDSIGSAVPLWGVTNSGGAQAIAPDSFKSFEFSAEWQESDYPQEGGAFQSYNKVQRPFEARLAVMKGGTDSQRSEFLTSVANLCASLDLVTINTPDATYASANAKHYDYRKTEREGVTLLTVEIWFEQVRVTATAAFSNTATPAGAAPVSAGAVQPAAPTAAEMANVDWQ